jgi:hypothetical protein
MSPVWVYVGLYNVAGDSADEPRVAEGADMAPADETLLEQTPAPIALRQPRPAATRPPKLAAAKPETNRQERLISSAYLVMFVLVLAFLAVTALVALL